MSPNYGMPFVTGAVFFVPFLLAVFLLKQLPPPTDHDVKLRTVRQSMDGAERWNFAKRFLPGLLLLLATYFFLTAFRDFRDNFQHELFEEMGIKDSGAFSRTERPVAFGVMAALAMLYLIKSNRWGLLATYLLMIAGLALLAISTILYQAGSLQGETWMILSGLGAYLAYVPYGSVLFDSTIAYTRYAGTAVFAIYLADAVGYTGSVGIMFYKDFFASETSRLEFFQGFVYVLTIVGTILVGFLGTLFRQVQPGGRKVGVGQGLPFGGCSTHSGPWEGGSHRQFDERLQLADLNRRAHVGDAGTEVLFAEGKDHGFLEGAMRHHGCEFVEAVDEVLRQGAFLDCRHARFEVLHGLATDWNG